MNGFLPRSETINCRNGAARSNPPRERREPTTFISSTVLLQMILATCGNLLLMQSNGKDPYSTISRTGSRADVSGGKSKHFCGERGILQTTFRCEPKSKILVVATVLSPIRCPPCSPCIPSVLQKVGTLLTRVRCQ